MLTAQLEHHILFPGKVHRKSHDLMRLRMQRELEEAPTCLRCANVASILEGGDLIKANLDACPVWALIRTCTDT